MAAPGSAGGSRFARLQNEPSFGSSFGGGEEEEEEEAEDIEVEIPLREPGEGNLQLQNSQMQDEMAPPSAQGYRLYFIVAFSFLLLACGFAAGVGSGFAVARTQSPLNEENSKKYMIGLWGDMPYEHLDAPDTDAKMSALVDQMNNLPLKFSIHVGDIKSGETPCTDDVYDNFIELTSGLNHAVIYTPGDNEWTDCHRLPSPMDPIERLAHLRKLYFNDNVSSLGGVLMQVERQSKSFPENQRWELGPAMFITLHVVGSNNNKVNEGYCATTLSPNRTQAYCEAANVEYAARNAANLEFLSQSFDLASEKGKKGILVAMQANPQFDVVLTKPNEAARSATNDGFSDFMDALYTHAKSFSGQVVLIHGDSHEYVFDKPFPLDSPTFQEDNQTAYDVHFGAVLSNFARVEVPGDHNIDWVLAEVDEDYEHVFKIYPMFI